MSLSDISNICEGDFNLYDVLSLTKLDDISKYITEIDETKREINVKTGNFELPPHSIMFVLGNVQIIPDVRNAQTQHLTSNLINIGGPIKCYSRQKVLIMNNESCGMNYLMLPEDRLWAWLHIVKCIVDKQSEQYSRALVKFLGSKDDIQKIVEAVKQQVNT